MIIVELALFKRMTIKEKVKKKVRKNKLSQLKDTFFKNVRIIFISSKYFIQNPARIVDGD